LKVEFTSDMRVVIDSQYGKMRVNSHASVWRNHLNYAITVDASFLPVSLNVGEEGIPKIASVLNKLLNESTPDKERILEFLQLAALGGTTSWLKTLEKSGLEAALTRLRKKYPGIEKYMKIALDLKKKGYFISPHDLAILGETRIYVAKSDFKEFSLCSPDTDPRIVQADWNLKSTEPRPNFGPRGGTVGPIKRSRWLNLLVSDKTASGNLCKALEGAKEPWIKNNQASLLAHLFHPKTDPAE